MSEDNKAALGKVRDRIDEIDDTFLNLLKERLKCAKEIGTLKSKDNRAKWDPLRERQIYDRLKKNNNKEFPDDALFSIFHEIITTCRLSQKSTEVAYLGPEATFSHLAAVKYYKNDLLSHWCYKWDQRYSPFFFSPLPHISYGIRGGKGVDVLQ